MVVEEGLTRTCSWPLVLLLSRKAQVFFHRASVVASYYVHEMFNEMCVR
jgi:hypothetical protein